jgi:peptidoglycan hydrolase-like protein with peptidoglycan-binding domain
MNSILNGDAVAQGNIIITSFDLFNYCNAVYNAAGEGSIVDSSTGSVAYELERESILSGVVEGPYKFLFNTVAFALYCRTNALRKTDIRSLVYNYVGEWNSSWTMYSDAILDEEKIQYFVNVSSNTNEIKFGRDLINSYPNILSYYKAKLAESVPDYYKDKISKIDTSNIDFYIEVTNPDVLITNTTTVSSPEDEAIPTSYFLKKMTSGDLKPYAYTEKYSPSISVPSSFGPYVVKDVPGISSSDTKKINSEINPITQFKSYPFNLYTKYSYISATDKPISLNGTLTTDLKCAFVGTATEKFTRQRNGTIVRNYKTKDPDIEPQQYITRLGYTLAGEIRTGLNCSNVKSSIDSNLYSSVDSDKSYNNFIYTRDIDQGNPTWLWSTARSGTSHAYVKYIQLALKSFGRYGGGNFSNWPVDGKYGTKTADAIKSFQETQKNLGNCIYVDGTVDSETKSLLARRLKTLKDEDIASYNTWRDRASQYGVLNFWDAAVASIENLTIGREYKKITFTGFEGPSKITDIIYFSIPEGYQTIKRLTVNFGQWRKAKIYSYGYSSADHSGSPLTTAQRLSLYSTSIVNKSADENGIVEIDLGVESSKCRHMFIKIESAEKLKNINAIYGQFAEGYSLESVQVTAQTAVRAVPTEYGWTQRVTGKTHDWSNTYEAVDSLSSQPDSSAYQYFNGKDLTPYASHPAELYYDYSAKQLKSNVTDKKIWIRGTEDGYYKWNGSSWIKEALPSGAFEVNVNITIEDFAVEETNQVEIIAYAKATHAFSNLSPTNSISYIYNDVKCKEKDYNVYFTSLSYFYKDRIYTQTLTPNVYSLNSGPFTTDGTQIKFDFSKPKMIPEIIGNTSSVITSLNSDTKQFIPSPSSVVDIVYSDLRVSGGYGKITLSTSSSYYSGSTIAIKTKGISSNDYVLVSVDGNVLDSRETVTVHDGIVLLAQKPALYESGKVYLNGLQNATYKPIGIPSYQDISPEFPDLSEGVERDIRFGDIDLYSNITNTDGIIYGFFDNKQKEFIGKKISYIELLSRGIDNVYVAVCAIDADGNTQNKIDYIGPKNSNVFKPVNIPLKKIYPVYSVRFNSNSRIRIGNMSLDIEQKKAWPLSITQGSFIKSIHMDSNIYDDWKSRYLNQDLLCHYETYTTPGVSWSKIFGKGYYEVKDENPIVVSTNTIKVRQSPFLVWAEPSNYDYSILNLIRPQFEIYRNTNLSATRPSEKVWERIPLSKVKNYNSETGVIEFTERFVPDKESDIKISYVAKNSDIQIYQVNGEEIPLNPLLNKDTIQVEKPLYIYLLPTKIEKRTNINSTFSEYSKVTEYSNSYPVNFTYDKDIFNPTSNKYNPFALMIGIVIYSRSQIPVDVFDTRLKGGGISYQYDTKEAFEYDSDTISYWDMYPSYGMAYPKGGYVIIKLPKEVKENFLNITEIYDIVYRNLTAGVSFEIQDMDGNSFGVK